MDTDVESPGRTSTLQSLTKRIVDLGKEHLDRRQPTIPILLFYPPALSRFLRRDIALTLWLFCFSQFSSYLRYVPQLLSFYEQFRGSRCYGTAVSKLSLTSFPGQYGCKWYSLSISAVVYLIFRYVPVNTGDQPQAG